MWNNTSLATFFEEFKAVFDAYAHLAVRYQFIEASTLLVHYPLSCLFKNHMPCDSKVPLTYAIFHLHILTSFFTA